MEEHQENITALIDINIDSSYQFPIPALPYILSTIPAYQTSITHDVPRALTQGCLRLICRNKARWRSTKTQVSAHLGNEIQIGDIGCKIARLGVPKPNLLKSVCAPTLNPDGAIDRRIHCLSKCKWIGLPASTLAHACSRVKTQVLPGLGWGRLN